MFRDCEPFSSRNSSRTKLDWLLEALELQLNPDNFERTVNFNEESVLLRIRAPSSCQLGWPRSIDVIDFSFRGEIEPRLVVYARILSFFDKAVSKRRGRKSMEIHSCDGVSALDDRTLGEIK